MRDNTLPLYLVGETINARRAHLQARAGVLLQVTRGVYVPAAGDVEATILRHAVRIAHYLYPNAYLSSASALLLGPTRDGRLFVSGRRNQRTRLRTLEIIQNEAPPHPAIEQIAVEDSLGAVQVAVSAPLQSYLESFRQRSEHAIALIELRLRLAARVMEIVGSATGAARAVRDLAGENRWEKEGEAAAQFLQTEPEATVQPAKASTDLLVAWHGRPLGRLMHDGVEWRWSALDDAGFQLVRETTPGKLPAFVESLLPEGWLARVLHERDDRETLRHGRRYLSNILVVQRPDQLDEAPADVLQAPLTDFTRDGAFVGRYRGPTPGEIEESFEQNLALLYAHAETPRLSGVQVKAPMTLRDNGDLIPAIDLPFTHILKPAGTGGFETLPLVEWLCLELARTVGFEVPATALIDMPGGMAPALLVERFDIRRSREDVRRFALEDFCSVLDLPSSAKYDATIERVAKGLRPLSTDPSADMAILFRRALFAWLIADGDMHLKNLALLKIAEADARSFTTVRLAPVYDAVTTRVFPGLALDRMSLKLNGKDDRLVPADFSALAYTLDLPEAGAARIMEDLGGAVAAQAPRLRPPAFAVRTLQDIRAAESVVETATKRASAFAPYMTGQTSLPGFEESNPTDRLFFAIFPDPDTARRIARLAWAERAGLGLTGNPLAPDRLHITLHHLGDYDGVPRDIVEKAHAAARTVSARTFDVAFDHAMAFSGKPGRRPFVLTGGDGLRELSAFQHALGLAMARAGLGRHVTRSFTPHVTLLYDDAPVAEHPVEPIRWTAREFVLIQSRLGRTEHIPLARWTLG